MKRLHLLRHAKSSWDDATLADRDRPLAPRGRKAVRRLARWAKEHELRPDLVLCSPALRTTQTLEGMLASLGSPEAIVDDDLYHASGENLFEHTRVLPEAAGEVMLIGHNPGLADFCLLLAGPGSERDRVAENLPTGALALLDLDIYAWADAQPSCGTLARLVLPRELET